MPEPISVYDRPAVALSNLVSGRPMAAGRALISPNTLAPSDRKSLVEKWGLVGATKTLVEIGTHPLVMLALMLNARYPIAKMLDVTKMREFFVNAAKRPGFILRNIGTLQTNFANTPIPQLAEDMGILTSSFGDKHVAPLLTTLSKWEAKVGPLSDASQVRITHWLEGNYKVDSAFAKRWKLKGPIWTGKLTEQEQEVATSLRNMYNNIFDELYGTEDVQQLALRAMRRKGAGLTGSLKDMSMVPKTAEALRTRFRKLGIKVAEGGNFEALANEMTGLGYKGWDKISNRSKFVKHLRDSGYEVTNASGKILDVGEIRKLKEYAPQLRTMAPEDFEAMTEATLAATQGSEKVAQLMHQWKLARVTTPNAMTRRGLLMFSPEDSMLLNPEELNLDVLKQLEKKARDAAVANAAEAGIPFFQKSMPKILETGTYGEQVHSVLAAMSHHTRGLTGIRTYSLRALPVASQYLKNSGRFYAWTTKGIGSKVLEATADIAKVSKVGENMLRDSYIPQMLGATSFPQSIQSMKWADARAKWTRRLTDKSDPMTKWIPEDIRKWAYDNILQSKVVMTPQGASSALTGMFYTSTLGFNVGSAIKNVMQSVLTTVPLIGPKATLSGMKTTLAKTREYYALRGAGATADDAFEKTFKDFIEAGLEPSPITERLLKGDLENTWISTKALSLERKSRGVKRTVELIRDMSLDAFQKTELFNRLTPFYGARDAALAELGSAASTVEGRQLATSIGRRVTQMTQFPAGPGQTPYMLRNVPGVFRQFLHFPLRFSEFLGTSTMTPWAGMPEGATGRNWGPIARAAGLSSAIYIAGRDALDLDLSAGLVSGALPLPQFEGSPFYPVPVLPPILSLGGAAIQSAFTGDPEAITRAAPLMVPFGIAGKRAYQYLAPKYADYKDRDNMGRIPLYGSKGSLVGRFTPLFLLSKAIGLGNITMTQEREFMSYLLAQRDQLRQYRRDYLEAIYKNDMTGANKVQAAYQNQYPEFGPLRVKKTDLRAIGLRRKISRLERVLKTMPPEYRSQFARLISQSLTVEAEALVGIDPNLLEAPRSYLPPPKMFGNRSRTQSGQRAGLQGGIGQQQLSGAGPVGLHPGGLGLGNQRQLSVGY